MIYPKDFINKTVFGDCLYVLPNISDEVVDLIYLDPPFGENNIDAPYGLKWRDKAHYISWMRERLVECRRVLKSTGSIYLHCDWHSNAHLRLMMDGIFGLNNFRNEIIWCYNTRTMTTDYFAKKHDTIFFYGKTSKVNFNPDIVRVPHRKESLIQYNQIDEQGNKYKKQSNEQRTYLNPLGQPCSDIWEFQILGSRDRERVHSEIWNISKCIGGYFTKKENRIFNDGSTYPNQKPIKLLKRIIKASSNPGDVVLDPMCGSGTTLQAAYKLNRKFIGIDRIKNTVQISNKRLDFDLRQRKID